MVRIKCRGCGNILIDTEAGVNNTVMGSELTFDEEWRMRYEERWVVCTNCGHKVEIEKLRKVIGNGFKSAGDVEH